MEDQAKFPNPITWVSLAPEVSSTWVQTRRGGGWGKRNKSSKEGLA